MADKLNERAAASSSNATNSVGAKMESSAIVIPTDEEQTKLITTANDTTAGAEAVQQTEETSGFINLKNAAVGLMDVALLSANANQLKLLLSYNQQASMYTVCLILVILSLIMQIIVGIGLIFKRHNKTLDDSLIQAAVFFIMIINVLLTILTTTKESKAV